jgi:membrane fusion protein, multidrug efflux system
MKTWIKWTLAMLCGAAIAAAAVRAISARSASAKEAALAMAAKAAKAEVSVELIPSDIYTLTQVELSQGIPISGSIKAVNSALVKARVAGELQGLTVREGDVVKAGQIIARIDSSEYAARVRQFQETADAAKAQIDIAQRSFNNNKALVDQGFISRTALDTSLASLQSAQANHKAALASLDIAKKSVQDTVLTAPIQGIISQRLAQPGERVGIDTRVVEIVDLSRLELEAMLSASDSIQVRVGQTARLKIEGRTQEVSAMVSRINPSASTGSRSVLVYLSLEQLAGLRQGLFAQGMLDTARETALAAPLNAVRTDKPQPYVQLIKDGRISHQTVELGGRGEVNGQTMIAIKNVAAGAILTTAAAGNIRENTKVSTQRSSINAAASTVAAPAAKPASATGQ